MIVIDEEKCTACGRCVVFCPREALWAWGTLELDSDKCTDCFDGIHHFAENVPLTKRGRKTILARAKVLWDRLCIINCPNDALRAE